MKISRFSDIPRLMTTTPYDADIPWQYLRQWIDGLAGTTPLDLDPDYQRGHVWTREQQSRWVEFALRGGQHTRNLYLNCPSWMGRFCDPLEVVDGKQRLTAALAFLNNEIPAFGTHYEDFDLPLRVSDSVCFTMNIHHLKNRRDVYQWYLDLNEGGTVHTQGELDKVRALIAAAHE